MKLFLFFVLLFSLNQFTKINLTPSFIPKINKRVIVTTVLTSIAAFLVGVVISKAKAQKRQKHVMDTLGPKAQQADETVINLNLSLIDF